MSLLTSEQMIEIRDYWTLPPKERDTTFGTWPLRNARDDIKALLGHITAMQIEGLERIRASLREEEWP